MMLIEQILIFSSPLGDGLVPTSTFVKAKANAVFVPAWGWVGSEFYELDYNDPEGFRSRLGMGWFVAEIAEKTGFSEFSSPLGDGLVRKLFKHRN